MRNLILTLELAIAALLCANTASAQIGAEKQYAQGAVEAIEKSYAPPQGKEIYIPKDLKDNDFTKASSQWSYARCAYTDDVVVFWEKPFGEDLSQAPDLDGHNMKVDLPNLLSRIQSFYDYFKNELQFIKPGSNADRYRMMVMLNYSLEGTAYGGDYDEVIGALWIAPNRVQDEKLNCIAHELGHSFQSMISCDKQGESWGGGGIFEMASQWMLFNVNPEWPTDENYHWKAFIDHANLRFLDGENIYHSPYMLEYWSMKHGLTVVGDLFRAGKRGEDPASTYMRMFNLSNEDFAKEAVDCYSRLLTFDFPNKHEANKKYAGEFLNNKPLQMFGANVVKLDIKGEKVARVKFEGTNKDDGYAYRLVAVNNNAEATYGDICTKQTGAVKLALPADTKDVYFVVTGYPKGEYKPYTFNPQSKPEEPHIYTYSIKCGTLSDEHPAKGTTFTSPNGVLKVNVNAHDSQLTYTVYEGQNIYALDNAIALHFEGKGESAYTSVSAPKLIKESITAPLYKFAAYDDEYNQVIVKSKNGVNVEFRAYNTGVAYRFFTTSTKSEWKVTNEVAEFNFADDHTAYLAYSTNEKSPKAMAFQATYDVAPLSQTRNLEAFLPATIDCGKAKVTILETDVEGYPGMFVLPNGETTQGLQADFAKYPKTFDHYPWRQQKYVTSTEDYIAKGKGNRTFPWRILAITHEDKEMPTNTLAYSLASSSRIKGDASWIKPGKVAWDWWNDWGLSGVDFKAGINQQTYQYYIDFAAQHGLEYIILDEGWYNPKSGDMLTVIPDLNLPALVNYAKQKNVGIILWTVFNVLDAQLEEACEKYAAMGIKGFKVDFLDRYDQEGVDMIYRIAERCAQSHLLLDYHGIFAPQGINRTYPNVINFEAVFGMEETKWTQRAKHQKDGKTIDEPEKDMPAYDVTFPFIRGMAGYVDFTPGGLRNATVADFQPVYYNPMTMGTRCHQLAHYIVHDSPLTMLADSPTAYEKEPECTDFIASLPTVYDEMKVLDGKLGEYIITARRRGNDWYVAGETNWTGRDVELNSDFLPTGTYELTVFFDGINADKDATDYQTFTYTFPITHAPHEHITIHMASGGGFAAKLIRK